MRFEEFLKRWRSNPATTLQIALLIRVAAALRKSDECIGAVVVGSFAKESADRLSDIDLVAFCSEGTGQSVLRTVRQQIASTEILFTADGEHGPDSPFQKIIFADMTAFEFHVIAPDIKLDLEQPFVEIVNRGQCLESRASQRRAPVDRNMTVFPYGDRGLAWELFNCLKWLWRGEHDAARRYLIKLGKAIEASEGIVR
ncbi:nucleotidyltransferase domain-containing protein [Paraburkholderia sp. BR10882]|uniref:nucleotidyltransferase domain-containing protein n=1 Tax=unclassified Paraburkholderia TaxID=2615204 RepID=UPI0034CFC0F7